MACERDERRRRGWAILAVACVAVMWGGGAMSRVGAEEVGGGAAVRVGLVIRQEGVAEGDWGRCFSPGFLGDVARGAGVEVGREWVPVALGGEGLFDVAMIVWSGEKGFELSEAEAANFRGFVERGGFVLASAKCAGKGWAKSFEALVGRLWPEGRLQPLSLAHPVFHMLYEIEAVRTIKAGEVEPVWGLTMGAGVAGHGDQEGEEGGGRLGILYSPVGLHDEAALGAECCCCGGNAVRNARAINANALVYALTH